MKKIILLISITTLAGCGEYKSERTLELEKQLNKQHEKVEAIKDTLFEQVVGFKRQ